MLRNRLGGEMTSHKKQEWIKEGYRMVANTGFNNLNIKSIALTLKKSKSSFYHYFGDKAIFEAELLNYHLDRVEAFSQEVAKCKSIRPDYLNLLLAYKTDFLFHKQLRLNRDKPNHKKCFEKAFTIYSCLLYTSPSPRDLSTSRMPSSA